MWEREICFNNTGNGTWDINRLDYNLRLMGYEEQTINSRMKVLVEKL